MTKKMPAVDSVLVSVFTFSVFFTNLYLSKVGGGKIQWHQIVFTFLLLRLLFSGKGGSWSDMFSRLIIPGKRLMLFVFYCVVMYLVNIMEYGFTPDTIKFVYCFGCVSVLFSLCRNYSLDDIHTAVIRGYLCAFAVIMVWTAFEASIIISFIRRGGIGHPKVFTLVAGGTNLQASLLGMFSVFTMSRKYGVPLWCVCFAVSIIYGSRTGCIIDMMAIMWYFVFVRGLTAKTIFTVIPAVMIGFTILLTSQAGANIVWRFTNTSGEYAANQRKKIWSDAVEVMQARPLGVGVGNTMKAIENVTGNFHSEPNPHNMYISHVAEEGVIVGVAWLSMSLWWILSHEMRRRFKSPSGAFLLMYYVQGLTQLTGVESWATVAAGVYFIYRWQERKGILQ